MAAKSFTEPVKHPQDLQKWFTILAAELHRRIIQHYEDYKTWPKTITFRYATFRSHYRSRGLGTLCRDEMKTHDILAKKFANLYNSMEDGYPCAGLDLMASNLTFDESAKSYTINKFFTKSTDSSAHNANGKEKHQGPIKFIADVGNNNNDGSSKPQKGLFSHIKRQSEQEETYLCDKCNQNILLTSVEEHSDYHFAMDLVNEERQQLQQSRSPSSPSPTPLNKRKNSGDNMNEQDKKQKRALFFQPKRAP